MAIANRSGESETAHMSSLVEGAVTQLQSSPSPQSQVHQVAAEHRVRIVIFNSALEPVAQADHEAETSLRDQIGDALFGPNGAPNLTQYDQTRPTHWTEVQVAHQNGFSKSCSLGLGGSLTICHHAARLPNGHILLAEKTSPRAIRALFDLRYPLLKLTLYVLLLSGFLAFALSKLLLRPVERLQREVRKRVASPHSAAPIPRVSNDEVGDLTTDFNALTAALLAKQRENEAFAADLAHELKSPILAISTCAEALQGPLDETRAKKWGAVLSESTRRLNVVTSQFLELARAEAGLPNEERSVFDLTALVRELCESAGLQEQFKLVRFDSSGPKAEICAAPQPVEKAVRNVLENAAAYSAPQGVVRVEVETSDHHVNLTVSDNGPGIDASDLPQIGKRFFTRRTGGTGLGLAYTKAVLTAHGGELIIHSTPGSGTSVTLRFPR